MIVACVYVCERGEYGRGGGTCVRQPYCFSPPISGVCVCGRGEPLFSCVGLYGGVHYSLRHAPAPPITNATTMDAMMNDMPIM